MSELIIASIYTLNFCVYCVFAILYIKYTINHDKERVQFCRGVMAFILTFSSVICFAMSDFVSGGVIGALGLYWIWQWWKNRRKGKWQNSIKLWGEKTKTLIRQMTEKITPSPIPRPNMSSPILHAAVPTVH